MEEKAKQRLRTKQEKTAGKSKREIIKHPEKFIMEYREQQWNHASTKKRVSPISI